MIFALLDEPSPLVLSDVGEARREFESLDLEAGGVRFFDETGRELKPSFPHRSQHRVFGMRVTNEPGPFELGPAASDARQVLVSLLSSAVRLEPNPWFSSIAAVRHVLRRPEVSDDASE